MVKVIDTDSTGNSLRMVTVKLNEMDLTSPGLRKLVKKELQNIATHRGVTLRTNILKEEIADILADLFAKNPPQPDEEALIGYELEPNDENKFVLHEEDLNMIKASDLKDLVSKYLGVKNVNTMGREKLMDIIADHPRVIFIKAAKPTAVRKARTARPASKPTSKPKAGSSAGDAMEATTKKSPRFQLSPSAIIIGPSQVFPEIDPVLKHVLQPRLKQSDVDTDPENRAVIVNQVEQAAISPELANIDPDRIVRGRTPTTRFGFKPYTTKELQTFAKMIQQIKGKPVAVTVKAVAVEIIWNYLKEIGRIDRDAEVPIKKKRQAE